MANRERGEIRLHAGSRVLTLRLTTGCCADAEDLAGKDLDGLIAGVNAGSVTDLRWLFWAALQPKHGDEFDDVEAVGNLIDVCGPPSRAVRVLSELVLANADDRSEGERGGSAGDSSKRKGWRQVYVDARGLGLTPDQFWALSLKELWRELAVGIAKQRREHDRIVSTAWWTVTLTRQRKLPALTDLLSTDGKPAERREVSWQSMKAAMQALSSKQKQQKGKTRGHR